MRQIRVGDRVWLRAGAAVDSCEVARTARTSRMMHMVYQVPGQSWAYGSAFGVAFKRPAEDLEFEDVPVVDLDERAGGETLFLRPSTCPEEPIVLVAYSDLRDLVYLADEEETAREHARSPRTSRHSMERSPSAMGFSWATSRRSGGSRSRAPTSTRSRRRRCTR